MKKRLVVLIVILFNSYLSIHIHAATVYDGLWVSRPTGLLLTLVQSYENGATLVLDSVTLTDWLPYFGNIKNGIFSGTLVSLGSQRTIRFLSDSESVDSAEKVEGGFTTVPFTKAFGIGFTISRPLQREMRQKQEYEYIIESYDGEIQRLQQLKRLLQK